jgi:Polyketide cyclase / dehydrase and lipid transport
MEMYHFRETADIRAPVATVWHAVVEPGLPRWTTAFRSMRVRGGGPLRLGAVVDATVRSRLPFSLSFAFEVVRLDEQALIEVRSWGDIVGTGSWTMVPDGGSVRVTYTWDVGLANAVLDMFGRLPPIKRVLARNHDRVMSEAFDAMVAELEGDIHDNARGRGNPARP